jgi:AP endonuclease 1
LKRCEQLGIRLYNFHPGSTNGDSKAAAVGRIAAQLNKAHKETSNVITVLENMAGSGNIVGAAWEDLRDIIALVEDKSRVGVCIDTCHAFAAGHDLRTPDAFKETMDSFDNIVGLKYLKAFHREYKIALYSNCSAALLLSPRSSQLMTARPHLALTGIFMQTLAQDSLAFERFIA